MSWLPGQAASLRALRRLAEGAQEGAAHALAVGARGRWRGHLFDGRFASVAMDEDHLLAAVRYVALNPVRARLRAEDDGVVSVRPVLERTDSFAALL